MNKRERNLLLAFGLILVAGGGVVAWSKVSQHWGSRQGVLESKLVRLEEARRWLGEKDYWLARDQWVAETSPPVYRGRQTETDFYQSIQASLAEHHVEIVEQRIQPTQGGQGGVAVGIDLVLNSSLENLTRWLHEIQRPEAFRAFTYFKIKSDGGNSHIRAEVSLRQLHDANATAQNQ